MPLTIGDRVKLKRTGRLGTVKGFCRQDGCYRVRWDGNSERSIEAFHIGLMTKLKPAVTDTDEEILAYINAAPSRS
jgi:uncharacterized protein YodC (DUF2158 family)